MPENTVQPTDFQSRSFHYRTLQADGARFTEFANCAIVADYGATAGEESTQAQSLGLVDLTPLPRTGFKGKQAIEWLRQKGVDVGDTNNFSWRQENGAVAARLADTEVLVLSDLAGAAGICAQLEQKLSDEEPEKCYHVPRRDVSAWFLVTGDNADIMFAKICGVDMRKDKFPTGSIAQTSMARMNAIAIRQDLGDIPACHLVFDCASADYLWRMLKDAMAEFGGKPVGYAAIKQIA